LTLNANGQTIGEPAKPLGSVTNTLYYHKLQKSFTNTPHSSYIRTERTSSHASFNESHVHTTK